MLLESSNHCFVWLSYTFVIFAAVLINATAKSLEEQQSCIFVINGRIEPWVSKGLVDRDPIWKFLDKFSDQA